MPAGLPYFAWIDVGETAFTAGHMRWDEDIFSFTLKQDEGDPASLTIAVRRPRNTTGDPIGLLAPGRKIWCWFALDCDGTNLIKFRGRLVGIPTSIFEDLVTLEFVAKPVDLVAQKNALAATLRVLPFYDEAVIDPSRVNDADVVLEGYTKIWHYDRETHVISVSDEITGDSTVNFDGASDTGKVFYDGFGMSLSSGPLARVDVNAEYTWTQQARGSVDLTRYLVGSWPVKITNIPGCIAYLNAGDWPKPRASIGDGWEVEDSSAVEIFDFTVHHQAYTNTMTVNWPDGTSVNTTASTSADNVSASFYMPGIIVTQNQVNMTQSVTEVFSLHDLELAQGLPGEVTGYSRSISSVRAAICLQAIRPTLVAGYTAARQYTERVSFSLFADVQPILTDPEDGEALRIDDIRSVNLSEGGQIGDPRRRSYIATARGNQSLEHLIALARAHLMKRARVVEIAFAPKLARMAEITLRKSAFLAEPRIGSALGKIIGYSLELDGSDGRIKCEVRIGCTIGRGGVAIATDGTPTYCTVDYVGPDYQQFAGRTVLVGAFDDTSVGYQPPLSNPNDDGLNFMSALRAQQAIDSPLVVEFGPELADAPQEISNSANAGRTQGELVTSDLLAAKSDYIKNKILPQYQTTAKFKLKSMTRDFSSDYVVQVTSLQIPTGYNLETV